MRDSCGECKYCNLGRETLCVGSYDKFTYGKFWGGYSTTLQQPAKFFFHIPENLDLQKSAPLLCAGVTVYAPMRKYLKPGANTAVIGVGGLGHLAVQFLAKLGHQVTAVTSSLDKAELITSLGATNVITMSEEDLMMNESSFDFIINTSPSTKNFAQLFDLCAPAGYFVQVGNGDEGNTLPIPCGSLVLKEINLVGSLVGTREDVNAMLKLCADNNIYPMNEEFSFDDFPKALDKLENGKPKFRCTVNVGEFAQKQFKK